MNGNDSSASKTSAFLLPFHGFAMAISFLSRLPAILKPNWNDQRVWSWSFAFYPIIGIILGLIAAAPMAIAAKLQSAETLLLLCAFYYLAISEWLTRFLHLDGFCDCCDAFSAMASTKEERLKIMKDPHLGSSAAGAVAILLFGKGILIYLLLLKGIIYFDNWLRVAFILIAIPALSRFAMLLLASMGRYPRESGTAMHVIGKVPAPALLFAAISLAPLALLTGPRAFLVATMLCAFSLLYWKTKGDSKIGGVTGDVLGACQETSELAAATGFLLALEANF